MPAPRAEVAVVALDGQLHALGGAVGGTAGPYHDVYDPATDRWQSDTPLPEGRDHLGVAAARRQDLAAFGGFVGSVHKGAGTDAYEYDPCDFRLAHAATNERSARPRGRSRR